MSSTVPLPKTIFKGEDKTYRLTITDADNERVDITGFALQFEVKLDVGDADPAIISKTVGAGITILTQSGSTLGQATVEVDSADTSPLAVVVHKYDVVAVDLAGERHVVVPPSDFDVRDVVNFA